jgi:hypothetical protein
MRNAVALHGLWRKFALPSVVMVALERNNGVYAHMVQGLGQPLLSRSRCRMRCPYLSLKSVRERSEVT